MVQPVEADGPTLQLPEALSDYDRGPWRCLRNIVSIAHWKAEVMRAAASCKPLSLARATSQMCSSPFEWNASDKTVFTLWTSRQGDKVTYHLSHHGLGTLVRLLKAEG